MKSIIDQPESQAVIEAYIDGSITELESVRLQALLAEEPEAVKLILEGLRDQVLIKAVVTELPSASSAAATSEGRGVFGGLGWRAFFGLPSAVYIQRALAIGAAGCVVFLVSLLIWRLIPVTGLPVLASPQGDGIFFERAGKAEAAVAGMQLQPGDRVRTSAGSTLIISYGREATRFVIKPGTELTLGTLSHGKRFQLGFGQIEASVARQRPFRPMIVKTPQAEAQVVGTHFTLTVTNNSARLEVAEGKVRFTRLIDAATVVVTAGHYAVAATNHLLAAQPLTGSILREYWTNIVADLETPLESNPDYPDRPSGREYLTKLEIPPNGAENFSDRIYGYLHPSQTGNYAFFVSGDDADSLWLSRDEKPENKMVIGYSHGDEPGQWAKSSQQSLTLTAGKIYYIEVMRRAGRGPNHLAVAWQPPGGEREIIPGEFLSPFKSIEKKNQP